MLEDLRDSLFKVEELSDNTFRIDTSRHDQEQWSVVPHFHEQYEILLYYDIKTQCMINGTEVNIGGGQAVFFPPYVIHSFEVDAGRAEYTVIQFTQAVAERFFGTNWKMNEPFICTYNQELYQQI